MEFMVKHIIDLHRRIYFPSFIDSVVTSANWKVQEFTELCGGQIVVFSLGQYIYYLIMVCPCMALLAKRCHGNDVS
jgi:hypothetical protein